MPPLLIDTSLWIDFTRSRSPRALKLFIAPFILAPGAHLTEPISFEILRHATPLEARQLMSQFQTVPMLVTPPRALVPGRRVGAGVPAEERRGQFA